MKPVFSNLTEWLQWQESLHPSVIDLGLGRIREVAARMGMLTLPVPVITVAGTNGKGSTVALLTSILSSANYVVGSYTSPHLLRYNERIAIQGKSLADEPICEAFAAIDEARADISLTYFEFGTLAAVWCFLQARVDVMVLEVGLGGRLDACNLWDADVAVITGIGIDHVDWLGSTREAIGREKAGIMRRDGPVICGDADPPASIATVALETGALLKQYGWDFDICVHADNDGFTFRLGGRLQWENLPYPNLTGGIQIRNAACALAALHELADRLPVERKAVVSGLQNVVLPGRLQRLPTQPELLLDVAHNPDAVAQLALWLKKNPVLGKTCAIFSILADKDIAGTLKIMAAHVDEWRLIPLQGARAVPPDVLKDKIRAAGIQSPVFLHADFAEAWQSLKITSEYGDRVVAFGSFLVVSGMLGLFPA